MKRKNTILIIGITLFVALIFVTSIKLMINKSEHNKFITSQNNIADSLVKESLTLINNKQLDSATIKLVTVGEMVQNKFKPSVYDSAMKLLNDIDKFRSDEKGDNFKICLANMNDEDYSLLIKNQLYKQYYLNPALNKAFIEILYLNRFNRSIYIIEEQKRQAIIFKKQQDEKAKQELEVAIANSLLRERYSEKLRENYLDHDLDVKVSAYGKNNVYIKLTFVLFDDVWAHKIQKGALINEIRDLGFKRLTLSNGYDYNVYWDF